MKRSFHLISLSRLIKHKRHLAHGSLRSSKGSLRMLAEGFCVEDNEEDDFFQILSSHPPLAIDTLAQIPKTNTAVLCMWGADPDLAEYFH